MSFHRGLAARGRRCSGLGGKRNIPHSGAGANVHYTHDMLEVGIGIATDADGLVSIYPSNGRKFVEKSVVSNEVTIDVGGAIRADVDDDFQVGTTLALFAIGRRRDGNLEVQLGARELPSDDEKDEQQKDDVDHGR